MGTQEFLTEFKRLSHPNFDFDSFRPKFIKAAWKTYTEQHKNPIPESQFHSPLALLFDTLFLKGSSDIESAMKGIHDLFDSSEGSRTFLSDTFYIVLSYYIKSFYGNSSGWEQIVRFATAIERFITYTAHRTSDQDESLFMFEDTLIDELEALRQKNESIMVLNTYYGVPIQYKARIVHTDTQSVTLKVHPIQETAAVLQNGIYILKNNQFSHDIYAAVTPKFIDGERLLVLSRFDQLETSLFHRHSVRVHPPKPFMLHVTYNTIDLKCNLFDMSLGGVAATSKYAYSIEKESELSLSFPIEMTRQLSDVHGSFIFRSSYEGGYKYHFKMDLTKQQEADLSKYIVKREQEIIKKLRDEIV